MSENDFDDRSELVRAFDALRAMARLSPELAHSPQVARTLRLLAASAGDPESARDAVAAAKAIIRRSPGFLEQQRCTDPFALRRSPNVLAGPVVLGRLDSPLHRRWPVPVGIFSHEINRNMLICGATGMGKTNLIYAVLSQLRDHGTRWLAIDTKKDYRRLLRRMPGLHVHTDRTFRFNPLVPPEGTSFDAWSQIFVDLFVEAFFAETPHASAAALRELLPLVGDAIAAAHGPGVFPTLHDVHLAIALAMRRERFPVARPERLMPIQGRIAPLLRLLGPMLDTQSGFDLATLLQHDVVLELDDLGSDIQRWLVNLLFHGIFTYRLKKPPPGRLLHCLVFDEAKSVFGRSQATDSSTITRLLSTARGMGECVLCGDQMPADLGHALLANVFGIVCLGLPARRDQQEMASAMGLDERQRDVLRTLSTGEAIVKFAGRYPWPFRLRIPRVAVDDVDDGEVVRTMEARSGDWSHGPRLANPFESAMAPISSHNGIEEARDSAEDVRVGSAENNTSRPDLPDDAVQFLEHVRDHPFLAKTEHYAALAMTPSKGHRIGNLLLKRGYLEEVEVAGGPGRPRKMLAFTEKSERRHGRQTHRGKGGLLHAWWQQRICDSLAAKGRTTEIEAFHNGKAVDVGVFESGDPAVAIEIGMSSPAQEVSNIAKDFEAGWPVVWAVCRDEEFRAKLREAWEKVPDVPANGVVEFLLLSDPRLR